MLYIPVETCILVKDLWIKISLFYSKFVILITLLPLLFKKNSKNSQTFVKLSQLSNIFDSLISFIITKITSLLIVML